MAISIDQPGNKAHFIFGKGVRETSPYSYYDSRILSTLSSIKRGKPIHRDEQELRKNKLFE